MRVKVALHATCAQHILCSWQVPLTLVPLLVSTNFYKSYYTWYSESHTMLHKRCRNPQCLICDLLQCMTLQGRISQIYSRKVCQWGHCSTVKYPGPIIIAPRCCKTAWKPAPLQFLRSFLCLKYALLFYIFFKGNTLSLASRLNCLCLYPGIWATRYSMADRHVHA